MNEVVQPGHRRVLVGVALLAAGYFTLLVGWGRFAHTDEAFFKAAGREWAATGRFAAPELHGFYGLRPPVEEVFFAQPPLYPFGFGLFARAFGFGWRTCVAYDALIHVALALATLAVTRRLAASPVAGGLAACLVLPLGTTSRPDELAMCFAMLAAGAVFGRPLTLRRLVGSGALLGLAAGTSVGVAVVFGLVVLVRVVLASDSIARLFIWLVVCGAASGIVLATVAAPILVAHPDAYHQYLGLASSQVGSSQWGADLGSAWRYGKGMLILDGAGLIVGAMALSAGGAPQRTKAERWLGITLGVLFVLIFLPAKYTYFWFAGPWLLAVGLADLRSLERRRLRALGAAILAVGCGFGSVGFLWQRAVILGLSREQRVDYCERRVRETIPRGAKVVAGEYWWSLAGDHEVLDVFFAVVPNLSQVDYIVLTGNGSGEPGKEQEMSGLHSEAARRDFAVLDDHLNRSPTTVLGRRVTNSAWGFGALILENRRLLGAPPRTVENRVEAGLDRGCLD